MKKCICIRTGRMLSGSLFCVCGDTYYYKRSSDEKYIVNSRAGDNHIMNPDFFHEYFDKHEKIMDIFGIEEFEI